MSAVITQSAHDACANLDAAARKRADRLAQAINDQIQAALAQYHHRGSRVPGPDV